MLPLEMIRRRELTKLRLEGLERSGRESASVNQRDTGNLKEDLDRTTSKTNLKSLLLRQDYLRTHEICRTIHEKDAIDGKAEIECVWMANKMSRRHTDLYNLIGRISGFWIMKYFESREGIDGLSTINEKPLKTTGLHIRIGKALGERCVRVGFDRCLRVKLCDGSVRDMFILDPAHLL